VDGLFELSRPHVVLLVVPAAKHIDDLVRCLLAVGAVALRTSSTRHAQALVETVGADLAVVDARMLDTEAGMAEVLTSTSLPLVLLGEPASSMPSAPVASMAADVEPFEVAIEVERQARSLVDGVLSWGPLSMDLRRRECTWYGLSLQLSPTQFRIMAILVHARGSVVSRPELCRRSLGTYVHGDCERLDAHVRRIRKLIEVDPARAAFLLTVRGEGIRLADPSTVKRAPLVSLSGQADALA
jgi:DNA-binding response OmpR family regulator